MHDCAAGIVPHSRSTKAPRLREPSSTLGFVGPQNQQCKAILELEFLS